MDSGEISLAGEDVFVWPSNNILLASKLKSVGLLIYTYIDLNNYVLFYFEQR